MDTSLMVTGCEEAHLEVWETEAEDITCEAERLEQLKRATAAGEDPWSIVVYF